MSRRLLWMSSFSLSQPYITQKEEQQLKKALLKGSTYRPDETRWLRDEFQAVQPGFPRICLFTHILPFGACQQRFALDTKPHSKAIGFASASEEQLQRGLFCKCGFVLATVVKIGPQNTHNGKMMFPELN